MLRLSNKAAALIIHIEKNIRAAVRPVCHVSRRELMGRMRVVRCTGRRGGVRVGVCIDGGELAAQCHREGNHRRGDRLHQHHHHHHHPHLYYAETIIDQT